MEISQPGAATRALIEHLGRSRYDHLPSAAIEACQTFTLDSLGVALSGTRVSQMPAMHALARTWGQGDGARVWGTGERVPAASAAFLNSYQIHNQEWDCVHEPAVVHPMAVVLATLLAHCEARGNAGRVVDGRSFVLACILAVDTAATIGVAAHNKLRFFRPAMCGALGATAGIAVLENFDAATTRSALGLCYSQLSGTMQAHTEGSPVLPMQIGFNTRAALNAIELAGSGIIGPGNFLEGAFGFFTLMDPDWSPAPFAEFGARWRITELSHKPYPSGRATHGGVDGALTLQAEHHFDAAGLRELRVLAPALVRQLVDRPATDDMSPAYARLCLPYVVATALLTGDVLVADFDAAALRDPARLALAQRIRVCADQSTALNSLAPQRVEASLHDGRELAMDLPAVLGAPGRPLGAARHLAKFRRAAASGLRPMSAAQTEHIIRCVDGLPSMNDVRPLIDSLQFEAP